MDCFSPDLPAAHSMDTAWFAVDEAGRVAIFDSGEDGAVPLATLHLGGASDPDPEALAICELLAAELVGDADRDVLFEAGPCFHYGNGDYGDPGRYVRSAHIPAQPANVSALPKHLREKLLRLPVDFTSTRVVHLADFMADQDAQTWAETSLRGEPLAPAKHPRSAPTGSPGWIVVIVLALVAAVLAAILSAG